MQPDSVALLWHVQEAAADVADLVRNASFDEYQTDRVRQLAVERAFTIIGEALNNLRKTDAAIASRIPNLNRIIGFRHILIHAYADIDHQVVWSAATGQVPELMGAVAELLDQH